MKYECALSDLEFYAFHGLYPEEKILGGTFRASVRVTRQVADHYSFSSIDKAMDYEKIFGIVKKQMTQREDLIETLAEKIMLQLREAFNEVEAVEVKISKPNPAGLMGKGDASVTLSC